MKLYMKQFELKKQGYKVGIVTTKARQTVEMGLQLSKLDEFLMLS